jgi:putative toxin-antitoxin system antitoxin component (TIGR02293 family)
MQDITPFSKDEWARFLDVSVKTLDRYRQDNKSFKAFQSEKIIGMIEVIERGVKVFGDMDMFKRWLYAPVPALSDSKPIELLSSSYGKELVLDELTRIEHGIFA